MLNDKRRALAMMGFLCSMAASSAAVAQTKVQDTGFRQNKVLDDTLLKRGRFEASVQSAGMWSRDKGTSADGTIDASASTLYLNPAATIGYMVLDRLQARLALGYLNVSSTNNDITVQNFGGFLGTLQALFHIPLKLGTAIYIGAGGGYFIGSTDRPGSLPSTTVSNPTSGLAGQGVLGLLLQPGPMVVLRGGLRFDALIGSESSADSLIPDIDSTNLKLMGEFSVGLRF